MRKSFPSPIHLDENLISQKGWKLFEQLEIKIVDFACSCVKALFLGSNILYSPFVLPAFHKYL